MESRDLLDLIWLVPALPALGAVVLLVFGKRIGEPAAGWVATALMGSSFVMSFLSFLSLSNLPAEERGHVRDLFTWFESGGFSVKFGFLVDPLSMTMILFVTGVGTLIHLYSMGYMHGDPRFSRFFAYMNLFAASMLMLVLGSSFVVTFLGWEGVALCSYLLVSFWFERNSAAVAGKKAFVTNRVGDFGFLLAMFLMFQRLGTLDYSGIEHGVGEIAGGTATAIALLLFVGAVGKSAQMPLHIWLPDAMEGPTPVSALIHAATMVTAGVFLVCRAHPFFEASSSAGSVVAWVGAGTALFAATVALVQNDIKRVLAYSTVSQLGYMFLAVGVGAYQAAIFHMVTHAFFKALLFLGSGSVIHGLGDEQDMRRMGGLKKYMPITAATFVVGWLAIAGIVPFAGFWSKDEILAKAWFEGQYGLWVVGAVGALLTAFYMTRQVWLVFYSPARFDESAHGHEPHESPWTMTTPLVALAVLSAVAGLLNLPFTDPPLEFLTEWLHPVFHGVDEIHADSFSLGLALSTVALVIGVCGILLGRAVYRNGLTPYGDRPGRRPPRPVRRCPGERLLPRRRPRPFRERTGYVGCDLPRRGSRPADDRRCRQRSGATRQGGGGGIRRLQSGLMRSYAAWIAVGTVALLAYFVVRVGL
ncbi:MAG: NADH-quinone oxidoreductase subunit L [Acidimicrobiia bacterium]|nr:NADH-quinone oxidoreductase subunit L [Acidimicrobiia bacterium]